MLPASMGSAGPRQPSCISCASSPSSVSFSIVSTLSNMSSGNRLSSGTNSSASQAASSYKGSLAKQRVSGLAIARKVQNGASARNIGPATAPVPAPELPRASYPFNVYANDQLMSAFNYDQCNQANSNSDSRPSPQATNLAANKLKLKSDHSGNSSTTITSTSNRYLKPHAPSGSSDSSLAEENPSKDYSSSGKVKSLPRHLLYQVLLSPIKLKVIYFSNLYFNNSICNR